MRIQTPCIFFYSKVNFEGSIPKYTVKNQISSRIFFEDISLSRFQNPIQTFIALAKEELPKAGDVVAIDTEFVSLRPVGQANFF